MARKWPTEAEIAAKRTKRGGWTRATLAEWGVPWPPPQGWRKALEMRDERFFETLDDPILKLIREEQRQQDDYLWNPLNWRPL